MRYLRIFCLLSLFLLSPPQRAQKDSTLRLSHSQWKELSDGIDYSENFEEPEKEKKTNAAPKISMPGVDIGNFKYVFYILIFALVVFLVVKIFGNFKNKKIEVSKTVNLDSMQEIEDNMHEINLEDLLQKALAAKNYRIALRVNFLIVIKLLSQTGKISWAKEKTNWEYYSELHDKLMADKFKHVIVSFENFWYGEHALTEFDYHQAEPLYRAMQNQLSPNE